MTSGGVLVRARVRESAAVAAAYTSAAACSRAVGAARPRLSFAPLHARHTREATTHSVQASVLRPPRGAAAPCHATSLLLPLRTRPRARAQARCMPHTVYVLQCAMSRKSSSARTFFAHPGCGPRASRSECRETACAAWGRHVRKGLAGHRVARDVGR